jgi:hypothetical protein
VAEEAVEAGVVDGPPLDEAHQGVVHLTGEEGLLGGDPHVRSG